MGGLRSNLLRRGDLKLVSWRIWALSGLASLASGWRDAHCPPPTGSQIWHPESPSVRVSANSGPWGHLRQRALAHRYVCLLGPRPLCHLSLLSHESQRRARSESLIGGVGAASRSRAGCRCAPLLPVSPERRVLTLGARAETAVPRCGPAPPPPGASAVQPRL